ncbi:MAG TPA: hypothetical protein PKM36_02920 [Propionibacteriaceae bacterium]|nr:hypothetical protein [Propionibacteriaceae bacterium]
MLIIQTTWTTAVGVAMPAAAVAYREKSAFINGTFDHSATFDNSMDLGSIWGRL